MHGTSRSVSGRRRGSGAAARRARFWVSGSLESRDLLRPLETQKNGGQAWPLKAERVRALTTVEPSTEVPDGAHTDFWICFGGGR